MDWQIVLGYFTSVLCSGAAGSIITTRFKSRSQKVLDEATHDKLVAETSALAAQAVQSTIATLSSSLESVHAENTSLQSQLTNFKVLTERRDKKFKGYISKLIARDNSWRHSVTQPDVPFETQQLIIGRVLPMPSDELDDLDSDPDE